jgi:hypothetical protein
VAGEGKTVYIQDKSAHGILALAQHGPSRILRPDCRLQRARRRGRARARKVLFYGGNEGEGKYAPIVSHGHGNNH